MTEWQEWAKKHELLDYKGQFRSKEWSLGGSAGACGCTETWSVSAEPAQVFTQFDDLLEKICPNVTFLQYRKLYNNCVRTETYSHGDYYGGCVDYAYFLCDVERLYNSLKKLGFVQE